MLHCDIVFPLLMAWYCLLALAECLCNVQDELVCVSAGRSERSEVFHQDSAESSCYDQTALYHHVTEMSRGRACVSFVFSFSFEM